jgi:hypothetical protein
MISNFLINNSSYGRSSHHFHYQQKFLLKESTAPNQLHQEISGSPVLDECPQILLPSSNPMRSTGWRDLNLMRNMLRVVVGMSDIYIHLVILLCGLHETIVVGK